MLSPEICEQARLARDPRFDGLFFILVKTTKIFCRNTCKVRMPLAQNISFANSAQQALDAGYRPCLRCRPDSAPQSYAWQGVDTTVKRAMKLLHERLNNSVEEIADSLGISSRYLNKLFQTHLEMSPKRYRLYHQVLLAKSLLQQTNMSVDEVAFNVGFANARQLQQHAKTHLRLTPTQIRQNKVNEKNDLANEVSLFLAYRPPYNWPQVRDFFALRLICGNEQVAENTLCKVLRVKTHLLPDKGHSVAAAAEADNLPLYIDIPIQLEHEAANNGFRLKFNAQFAPYTLNVTSMVKRLLDLDADPQTIKQAMINAGLKPSELVEGIRIPGVASEFEAGCRAILGQQVSVKAAINKVNTLYSHFAHEQQKQFTPPVNIAGDTLEFLKMPEARKRTLIEFAKYYQAFEEAQEDDSQDIDKLIDIKGIGPWTVNYIKMRALANTDIWLDTDLIIKQQALRLQNEGRVLKPHLAAPWRTYLTLNLWALSANN
jgi:AraC family transcriptional regulator of adaptative response / DNA-3-methyladenine glycosylase II